MDTSIFFDNHSLNKNKLREVWVQKNLNIFYKDLKEFQNKNNQLNLKFSQVIYNYLNDFPDIPKCTICLKKDKRFIGFKEGYNDFCSKKCASDSSRTQALEKRKSNTLEKWGVDHTSKLESVKSKQKQTNIERYGFISPTLNDDIREKQIQTMLYKYNVKYSGESSELLKKSLNTRFDEYKKTILSQFNDLNIIDIPKEGDFKILCNKCNKEYEIKGPLLRLRYFRYKIETCLHCNPLSSYKYSDQKEILETLSKYFDVEVGDRNILNGKEIDLLIREKNVAIEFNGVYWHSELFKDKNYHLNKKETCEKKNINLIHIWEDDWLYKKEIVISRLLNILGVTEKKVMARKCEIRDVTFKESKEFLESNHLQGNINSKYRFGLYYEDELISLMTFGKMRVSLGAKSEEDTWELYRFSSKINYNVVGSFSKLLKYFEKTVKPKKIVTYANRDWSMNENVYEKNGFEFVHNTTQNYWYFDKNLKKYHRFSFRKDKIKNLNLDEYLKVWDCGSKKYIKRY
jgi:hypothetical protein